MPEGEQFGFEGGAMANGVTDGDEKSEEDTINQARDSVTDGVLGRDRGTERTYTRMSATTPKWSLAHTSAVGWSKASATRSTRPWRLRSARPTST